MLHATRSSRQAQSARGFITGALSGDLRYLTFWTVTVWESEAAMQAYRAAEPHKTAMRKIGVLCDEAAVAHLHDASEQLPSGEEAVQLMRQHGRVSRLLHPSRAHAAGETVPGGRPPRFAAMRSS